MENIILSFNPYCYWSYLLTVKEYKRQIRGIKNEVSILIVTGLIF